MLLSSSKRKGENRSGLRYAAEKLLQNFAINIQLARFALISGSTSITIMTCTLVSLGSFMTSTLVSLGSFAVLRNLQTHQVSFNQLLHFESTGSDKTSASH